MALTGALPCRYPWVLLQPLVLHLLQQVLQEYDERSKVEVGPAPPPAEGESAADVFARLSGAVQAFSEAPFTIQRLAELLLEPRRQYMRTDKLVCTWHVSCRLLMRRQKGPLCASHAPSMAGHRTHDPAFDQLPDRLPARGSCCAGDEGWCSPLGRSWRWRSCCW